MSWSIGILIAVVVWIALLLQVTTKLIGYANDRLNAMIDRIDILTNLTREHLPSIDEQTAHLGSIEMRTERSARDFYGSEFPRRTGTGD